MQSLCAPRPGPSRHLYSHQQDWPHLMLSASHLQLVWIPRHPTERKIAARPAAVQLSPRRVGEPAEANTLTEPGTLHQPKIGQKISTSGQRSRPLPDAAAHQAAHPAACLDPSLPVDCKKQLVLLTKACRRAIRSRSLDQPLEPSYLHHRHQQDWRYLIQGICISPVLAGHSDSLYPGSIHSGPDKHLGSHQPALQLVSTGREVLLAMLFCS